MEDPKRRATLDEERRGKHDADSALMGSDVRKDSLDESIAIHDQQSKSPPYDDGLRGNYGAININELQRARINTDSSSPEQHTFMANQTRDTSLFATAQHSKDMSKHQATPISELKSEPRMSKRSSARKESFRQMQFENEKLKTCIEFLVQGGDWNELVQMFGEHDPVLKDIVENYLNKSSQENPLQTAQESYADLDGPPIQYSEQQIEDQNRSVERVHTYNQLDRQRVRFDPNAPEAISVIEHKSPERLYSSSQPSFLSSTEPRQRNRLSTKEK